MKYIFCCCHLLAQVRCLVRICPAVAACVQECVKNFAFLEEWFEGGSGGLTSPNDFFLVWDVKSVVISKMVFLLLWAKKDKVPVLLSYFAFVEATFLRRKSLEKCGKPVFSVV